MMSGGELLGDPAQKVTGAASLAEATDGDVSFFGTPKYVAQLRKTRASAVFVPLDFSETIAAAQIRVANPAKAFEQVVLKLAPKPVASAPGVHPRIWGVQFPADYRADQFHRCRRYCP